MSFFGRACQLLFVPAGANQAQQIAQDQSGTLATDVSTSRIRFSVQKMLGPATNRAHIQVWNLNPELRRSLAQRISDFQSQPRPLVYLSAGYTDTMALICRGSILRCINRHDPPDWVTEVDVLTDWQQTSNAIVPSTLANQSNTEPKVLVDALFAELKWGAALYAVDAEDVIRSANSLTVAVNGLVADQLTTILHTYGLTWMIDDRAPVVFTERGAVDPSTPAGNLPVLSEATGVVGTPQVTDLGVEIRTLLNPSLRIGRRFMVNSPTIQESLGPLARTQQYVATQVRHEGDTWGNEWTTWIEGAYYPYQPLQAQDPTRLPAFIATGN
jgi:hypothetical protein